MPPSSDGTKTVGCAFGKLVPDPRHREVLSDAISRVHKATFLATELLNLHVRRSIRDQLPSVPIGDANWLLNLYNLVTVGKGKPKEVPELQATFDQYMPPFRPVDRAKLTQLLMYECRNLSAVACTNVWKHFQARVKSYVRTVHSVSKELYDQMSPEERRARFAQALKMAVDVCRNPEIDSRQAKEEHWAWVDETRAWLGIDAAVGTWSGKPLLYHLKAHPERFLCAMSKLSDKRREAARGSFALVPLRRTYVPRHVHFDQKALRDLLKLGESEYRKLRSKELRIIAMELETTGDEKADGKKRKRRTADDMFEEKRELFAQVVNLRAAGVRQAHRFAFSFSTDGICARVPLTTSSPSGSTHPTRLPSRGIWALDELKHRARLEELHVVGIDPGKHELLVAVDSDAPRRTAVRYTNAQRQHETLRRQYAKEVASAKPEAVTSAEKTLSEYDSRTADLDAFRAYCARRHETLDECLEFYGQKMHRCHRWKRYVKTQKSEERLYEKLRALHKASDPRRLILAYGSWGAVAGPQMANRGLPPCIGKGLMHKLSRRFLVAVTPEAYTSKTCPRCFGAAGAATDVEQVRGKKIRGLRRCHTDDCTASYFNRDRMGACNIATNFCRLLGGEGPLRSSSPEDLALQALRLQCEPCS